MTPQEQQMLDGLIGRVQGTQLNGKDGQAEQHIQQALGNHPDALYILCQTVLVQGYALEQAQKQLLDAKQQGSAPDRQPSFLEKIFGSSHDQPQAQAQNPPQTQAQFPQQPTYGGQPGYGAPVYGGQGSGQGTVQGGYAQPVYQQPGYGQQYPPQQSGGFGGGFGGGGFLQGAMQTAAGVAMGTLAVQGIEGLLSGFGHAAGYGSDRALGGFGEDHSRSFADNDRDSGDNFGDRLQAADGAAPGLSDGIEDRRGESHGFFDGGDNSGTDSFADDTASDTEYDDSSSDDAGGDFSDDNS